MVLLIIDTSNDNYLKKHFQFLPVVLTWPMHDLINLYNIIVYPQIIGIMKNIY